MKQGNKDNIRYNSEGYPSPVEYEVLKSDNELEKSTNFLIKMLKHIIRNSGYELLNRIELRDIKSGREFK